MIERSVRSLVESSGEPEKGVGQVEAMLNDPTVRKVFDFDDTIAGVSHYHRVTYALVAEAQLGVSCEITPEFGIKHLRGKNGREVFAVLHSEFGGISDEQLVLEAVRQREDALTEMVRKEQEKLGIDLTSYLKPGIVSLVRRLRSLGQQAGIASQSPDGFIRQFTRSAFVDGSPISDVFPAHAVVGETRVGQIQDDLNRATDMKVPDLFKPNPFSLYQAARAVGIDIRQPILYFGDNKVDVQTVIGKPNIVGVVANDQKYDELLQEFGEAKNLAIIHSLEEIFS